MKKSNAQAKVKSMLHRILVEVLIQFAVIKKCKFKNRT